MQLTEKHQRAAELLVEIEGIMRELNLWSRERPPDESFASAEPFCIDTLSFAEWLQYVFIERLYWLVENGQPLPTQSSVVPMAEEYFRGSATTVTQLLDVLAKVDLLLTTGA